MPWHREGTAEPFDMGLRPWRIRILSCQRQISTFTLIVAKQQASDQLPTQTAVNLLAPIRPTMVNVRNYYRCSTLGCRSAPYGPSRCNKLRTPFDSLTDFDSFILNYWKHRNWSVGHFSDGSQEQCSLQHFGGNVQKDSVSGKKIILLQVR